MKHCIISFEDKEILDKITELGYECHPVIQSDRVSSPISCHSDVLYQKQSKSQILVSACQKENFALLESFGYNLTVTDKLSPGYMTECYLNYIVNDEYIVYNPKTALVGNTAGLKTVTVKQGYTKCSTVCLNSRAYITDDSGIYTALQNSGMDCLLMQKGDILLPGYDYGFIGGSCVKLNENEILFFGDIKNSDEKCKLLCFLEKYNMTAIFIEGKQLVDIGSALIL